jgi:branched-chain amino acid transport system substrate-binding protein
MSSWRPRVVVLIALALGASACIGRSDSGTTETPREVRIGLLAPLTGPNRAAGVEAQRGAQLAADVVNGLNSLIPLPLANESGLTNLGNAHIQIITRDVGSDPAGAGTAVTNLVAGQGAVAVVGGYDADVTVAASQRAERIPVPFVNGDSSVSFLTERGLDWFFRVGPSDRKSGEAFFSLLKRAESEHKPSTRRIAIMHSTDKAGNDAESVIGELAEEGNYQVVATEQLAPDAVDVGAAVARVQLANPDVVFLAPTPKSVPALINAFIQRHYKPKAVMAYGSGVFDAASLKNIGPAVTGLCREVAWSYDLGTRNDAARAVADLYTRKYNGQMTEEAASTFTAVLTLAIAINGARSTQAKRIRSQLLSLDIPGKDTIMPWAGIRFDETHENSGATSVVEQFMDKAFRPVFPIDAANKDKLFVYPAPGATPPVATQPTNTQQPAGPTG